MELIAELCQLLDALDVLGGKLLNQIMSSPVTTIAEIGKHEGPDGHAPRLAL